ncbi:hypothetical protein F5I97DRAFT_1801344 [Phlebopus sp. FC_14]|nr:hypothetical protein F5I97DRAFT_1801344 [Phlebopus sp. FC_14]
MSRRESRVSLNNRQHDALTEFENFKKKFLLANKHITKLNSTLSVRIEELQAQISALYVENLRLRASEIALAAQLKKEQEKSRKILADAETATSHLSKHLSFLRQTFNVVSTPPSPKAEAKPPPKPRRPVLDPNSSPQMPRLSRPPNIPGIIEDEEISSSPEAEEYDLAQRVPSPTIRRKTKDKLSRLPLPTREASPPPLPTPLHVNLAEREFSTKRKPSRRQSGLLSVNTNVGQSARQEGSDKLIPPRASSPAFGSPVRRDAGLAEDEEERRVDDMLSLGAGPTDDADFVVKARKEKKEKKGKQVEREITPEDTDGASSRVRERKRRKEDSGLKDVTNSPRSRALLPPLDTNTSDRDRQRSPDTDGGMPSSAATSVATSRTFLTTPATTPATTPQISQLPTPRNSSPIPPSSTSTSEPDALVVGRERRTRKSVNYTEPKLNTKMRKPDPVLPPAPPALTVAKKRASASAEGDDPERRSSVDGPSQSKVQPLQPPTPKIPSASSSSTTGGPSVTRKKSRPYIPADDDDESDGTQADAEYGTSIGWINVDGRRRSVQNGNANGSGSLRRLEADDARRHSLAV